MECLLSKLPDLQHLQLELNGSPDLFNGYRWQTLTHTFTTFNFKFNTEHNLNSNFLESFSTSFWLSEKHWFIGYYDCCLFSVPHFIPDHLNTSKNMSFVSTALDPTLLYSRVNTISLKRNEFECNNYFTHISTLELTVPIPISILASFIDLNQIKHLSLSSLYYIPTYVPFANTMSHLRELTIRNQVDIYSMNHIRGYRRFEQIHKLEISIMGDYSEYITEKIIHLFPFVQHLKYTYYTNSEQIMFRCINGFTHLLNASFFIKSFSIDNEESCGETFELIIKQSRRLVRDNFTYRMYRSPDTDSIYSVHWWFGTQVSHLY